MSLTFGIPTIGCLWALASDQCLPKMVKKYQAWSLLYCKVLCCKLDLYEDPDDWGWSWGWLTLLGLPGEAPRRTQRGDGNTYTHVTSVPTTVTPDYSIRSEVSPHQPPAALKPKGRFLFILFSLHRRMKIWERMLFLLSCHNRGAEGKMNQYFTLLLQHWAI